MAVSTHSRLKAAGRRKPKPPCNGNSFNTQPPEGGWRITRWQTIWRVCFNTQPPEGGWDGNGFEDSFLLAVSTHSRLKAAGIDSKSDVLTYGVSTHSRLKAAGPKRRRLSPRGPFQHTAA